MADNEYAYTGLTLNVRHVPDYSTETDATGNRQSVELPGFIEFGVVLDGHFETLYRRKAAGLFSDIERAKQNADTPADTPQTTP